MGLGIPEAVGDEDRRGDEVEAPLPPGDGDPIGGAVARQQPTADVCCRWHYIPNGETGGMRWWPRHGLQHKTEGTGDGSPQLQR